MSAYILNLQKDLLVQMMERSPDYVLQLVLKEESNSILEMDNRDLKARSFPGSKTPTRQELLNNRKEFWEKSFKDNPEEAFECICLILKDKSKVIPHNFDFINKLLLEENIH